MAAAAPAGRQVSACRKSSTSPTAAAAPTFIASARLPGAVTTIAPAAAAASAVPSLLPASITSTSQSPRTARADATAAATPAASFRVGITTEIVSPPLPAVDAEAHVGRHDDQHEADADEEREPPEPLVGRPDGQKRDRDRLEQADHGADTGMPPNQQQHAGDELDEEHLPAEDREVGDDGVGHQPPQRLDHRVALALVERVEQAAGLVAPEVRGKLPREVGQPQHAHEDAQGDECPGDAVALAHPLTLLAPG